MAELRFDYGPEDVADVRFEILRGNWKRLFSVGAVFRFDRNIGHVLLAIFVTNRRT